jgi:hypothetical protein
LFKLNDIGLHEAITGDGEDISVMINKSNLSFGLNKLSLVASSLDGCHTHIFDDALAVRSDEIHEVGSVTSANSCGNGSVVLSASGAPSEGSYLWYDSIDAVDPISGANEAVFNTPVLTESKTYFVTAVNESGCESSSRVPVEAKIINNPVPEIDVNGYVLTVSNAKSGIQWYKDDVPVEGATEVEFEVKESGSYKVSVEKDGCTAESEAREFIINGIEDRSSGYKIYPNPVDRELLITGPLQNVEISLYDGKGKLIAGNRDNNSIAYADGQRVIIDMSFLKKGLYLVNLQKGNHIFQFKVIKK